MVATALMLCLTSLSVNDVRQILAGDPIVRNTLLKYGVGK
jgi:hypothetical protein